MAPVQAAERLPAGRLPDVALRHVQQLRHDRLPVPGQLPLATARIPSQGTGSAQLTGRYLTARVS